MTQGTRKFQLLRKKWNSDPHSMKTENKQKPRCCVNWNRQVIFFTRRIFFWIISLSLPKVGMWTFWSKFFADDKIFTCKSVHKNRNNDAIGSENPYLGFERQFQHNLKLTCVVIGNDRWSGYILLQTCFTVPRNPFS